MSEERDPLLQELFAQPVATEGGAEFTAHVIKTLQQGSRRRRMAWLALDLALVLMVWLLSEPLQTLVLNMLPGIMGTLLDLGDGYWAQLVAPVNNLASVLALSFLMGRSIYKRLLL
jgi:hypothetical protein